jgi:magnesium transporter
MIKYLHLENQKLKKTETETEETVWFCVEHPTNDEIEHLIEKFDLPADYITSVLDDAENSRVEEFNQAEFEKPALLLLQYPFAKKSPSGYFQVDIYPFSIIVTPKKKLITIGNHEPQFLKKVFDHSFTQTDISPQLNIFFQLTWYLTIGYNEYLVTLKERCDRLESQLQVATENSQLYQLMDIQKSLIYFDSATSANLHALTKLTDNAHFQEHELLKNHLRDVIIETKQASTISRIQMKLVEQMNATFSAIVSNNLNNIMKILTSVTIVLTIPTIISGIYGMNTKLPIAERNDAFFLLSFITLVLCGVTAYILRKKNLL